MHVWVYGTKQFSFNATPPPPPHRHFNTNALCLSIGYQSVTNPSQIQCMGYSEVIVNGILLIKIIKGNNEGHNQAPYLAGSDLGLNR